MRYPSYEDVQKARSHLTEVSYQHWVHDDLWSFNWWLLLAATILPWFIWLWFVNRERLFEVFSYAMVFGVTATVLDTWGVNYEWWGYPDKLFAMIPPLFPADITVLPVIFSLLYQYGTSWKTYILYIIVASALISFVTEPIFKVMGLYENEHFSHTKSFLGFLVLALITKAAMEVVKKFKG